MAGFDGRRLVRLAIAMLLLGVVAGDAGAQSAAAEAQVLLTLPEAVREVFPAAVTVREYGWTPTRAQRGRLEEVLGRRLFEPRYDFLMTYDESGGLLGYALVTEERGKYRPITFMVAVAPDFRVVDTAVMVYRESRGGEVQRRRFLAQYEGKTLRDPIQINRDIINISGATISVRSMNSGVRKTLALAEAAFGGGMPTPVGPPVPVSALR